MKPIEKLFALGVTVSDLFNTARLLAEAIEEVSNDYLNADPTTPEWGNYMLRVLSTVNGLHAKVMDRVATFNTDVITYYREYLIALDQKTPSGVYQDAVSILRQWELTWPNVHQANMEGIVKILRGEDLPATDEIQILTEIHRAILDRQKPEIHRRVAIEEGFG